MLYVKFKAQYYNITYYSIDKSRVEIISLLGFILLGLITLFSEKVGHYHRKYIGE